MLKIVQGTCTIPAEQAEQEKWNEQDQDARADLLMALSPKIINLIKNLKTSRQIWVFLQETYDRQSPRQKIEVFRSIINLKMGDGDTITRYLEEFDFLHVRLEELGGSIDEELSAVVMVDGLSNQYKEIKAAFNMMNDVPSVNTLRSRLLEIKANEPDTSGDAMKAKFYSREKHDDDYQKYLAKRKIKC